MASSEIHLLDVGSAQYGDCVLCQINNRWILIDGGHKSDINGSAGHTSIPAQIRNIMGVDDAQPIAVDLLIVSHAHADHIGCLPELVAQGLHATTALMTDPDKAWPPVIFASDDYGSDASRELFAMLREERRTDLDEITYAAAATDAASLQTRYRNMISALQGGGTSVYLHGRDNLDSLMQEFADIDMRVIGPSNAALEQSATYLAGTGRDFLIEVDRVLTDGWTPFLFYQRLTDRWANTVGPDGAIGPAVNMQSSVVTFSDGDHQFLFSGDSQLEEPGVPGNHIAATVREMRNTLKAMAAGKPFDFVKVGHHGSFNALGKDFLSDLGEQTVNFGICTGTESRHHPSPRVLQAIEAHSDQWLLGRTDTNGHVCFRFDDGVVNVDVQRGQLNDTSIPEPTDSPALSEEGEVANPTVMRYIPPHPVQAQAKPVIVPVPSDTSAPGPVEVRIPYDSKVGLNISIQIKIEPNPLALTSDQVAPLGFMLANGRPLPKLLFVTSRARLIHNVGQTAVDTILREIQRCGHTVIDVPATPNLGEAELLDIVRRPLSNDPLLAGVIVIGGYDVVPAIRIDVLGKKGDPALRITDPDSYIVWTDNLFGDADGDDLPEKPVSRVPDGHSASLLFAALSAPTPGGERRHGIYNAARPFANGIFSFVPGIGPLHASYPFTSTHNQVADGDYLYLMLHGDHRDHTRFWGEVSNSNQDLLEAVHLGQMEVPRGAIIFTGCCWGGLPVREPAHPRLNNLTPRTAVDSIALKCLEKGALAYIGCTGVHYSPMGNNYQVGGAPVHFHFWNNIKSGSPPAVALFEAKKALSPYVQAHSSVNALTALDLKHFHQFCLLGLGW